MAFNDTDQLKQTILGFGADLVGVASTEELKALDTNPSDLMAPFARAVSIAVELPFAVFDAIDRQPTPIYATVYQTANRLLDDIAFKTAIRLQQDGYISLPIPASQVIDRQGMYGAISHKAVARMAGLGWQGKNLLLITPDYGSRVRLVTVLTNAPLNVDRPVENRCGKCMNCRDACPAGAIQGIPTADRYASRNTALHFDQCKDKLLHEFAKLPDIGAPICGICINACPFSRNLPKRN